MKLDMSPEAVTKRLKTVAELNRLCLSLADSSEGKKVRKKHPENKTVQRTEKAIKQRGKG